LGASIALFLPKRLKDDGPLRASAPNKFGKPNNWRLSDYWRF
jgi:hypothetical protein